jgi:hypothetical protein
MWSVGDNDNTPDKDPSRARASEGLPDHEALKIQTERIRIAWAESSEGTEPGKRALKKLRDTLREFTPLAMAKLIDLMCNGEGGSVQLGAVKEFFDRAYGKSKEHIELTDKRDQQAAAMVAELQALRKNPDTAAAVLVLAEASAKLAQKPRD